MPPSTARQVLPLRGRTLDALTAGCLASLGAVSLLLVLHGLDRARLLERLSRSASAVATGRAETSDAAEGLLRPLAAALTVLAAVLLVVWARRLRAARAAAGARLERPAWWLGPGWLLPPLPAVALPEAWRAPRRASAAPPAGPLATLRSLPARPPDAATLWALGWMAWVVAVIVSTGVAVAAGTGDPAAQARTAQAFAARDAATAVLSGLAVALVLTRPRYRPPT